MAKAKTLTKRAISGSIEGLIVGLLGGLVTGLIGETMIDKLISALGAAALIAALKAGLGAGLSFGVIFGLVSGLVGGLTDRVKEGKTSPNQGVKLSRQNSSAVFLVTWLIIGLIAGLNRGGSAVIKHYALRLILLRQGYTPLNLLKFLDHCTKLILLKKVGGSYIFVHRMLLEYFADLPR